MPYIQEEHRPLIDTEINTLVQTFIANIGYSHTGAANYTITRIILGVLKPKHGWNYDSLSNVIKTLECSKLEIYRRLVAPYEDGCIEKNGDLEELNI